MQTACPTAGGFAVSKVRFLSFDKDKDLVWGCVAALGVSNKAVLYSLTITGIKLDAVGEHKQYREGCDFICIPSES